MAGNVFERGRAGGITWLYMAFHTYIYTQKKSGSYMSVRDTYIYITLYVYIYIYIYICTYVNFVSVT